MFSQLEKSYNRSPPSHKTLRCNSLYNQECRRTLQTSSMCNYGRLALNCPKSELSKTLNNYYDNPMMNLLRAQQYQEKRIIPWWLNPNLFSKKCILNKNDIIFLSCSNNVLPCKRNQKQLYSGFRQRHLHCQDSCNLHSFLW